MDVLAILERFGVAVALVVIFSLVMNRFLSYLDNRTEAEELRQKSWDDIRRGDREAVTGLQVAITMQTGVISDLSKNISDERTLLLAFQNTATNALSELLMITKEFRGVPADVRKTNETLGIIQKGQVVITESEARRELETKAELARMNNAMLGIQAAVTRLETAVAGLPKAVQQSLTPIVTTLEDVLKTARDTSQKIDDLPLMAGENSHVEKELSDVTPADGINMDGKNAVRTDETGE